jgi:class 3 adenylate cyclase
VHPAAVDRQGADGRELRAVLHRNRSTDGREDRFRVLGHVAGLFASDPREERRVIFRVGVNVGDIIVEGNDILGDGVSVAARLEALPQPGGVCISGTVYDYIRDKLSLPFIDQGEQTVKNIARPVRVYALSGSGGGP